MRKDLYEEMYRLEESYWWHVAKRRLVQSMVKQYLPSGSGRVALDVGCGTGKLLKEMKQWKRWQRVIGMDGADEALKYCLERGITDCIKANFESKLPLADDSVDLITSLDVVEHVKKDQQLLREFSRVLKPGGLVIVTVPAHQWLWTYWDDILGHKRRYTTDEMKDRFIKAKLEIIKVSYFYSYLLPIALVFRYVKRVFPGLKGRSDFVRLPEVINKLLLWLSRIETEVVSKQQIPTGLSVVCVGRRR